MATHKAGELIALSSGEYSDYSFNGLYRVLIDFDLAAQADAYVEQAPVCEWDPERKETSDTGFGSYMIAGGLVEELSYDEIHCGVYYFSAAVIRSRCKSATGSDG